MISELLLSSIVFREDLYPRIQTNAATVQKYAADIAILPPIEVNQQNEIIDGWHRWTAHRKVGAETIRVTVTETKSEAHFLELAITRNATHGLQLSDEDKSTLARKIYTGTSLAEQGPKKKVLATILSVSLRVVEIWLSRIDRDNREKRECTVRDLWLANYTQEEIADAVGMSQVRIHEILSLNETFRFPIKLFAFSEITDDEKRLDACEQDNRNNAEHATDFEPPLYNIWRQQSKTPGQEHFGTTEIRWLDNLLYLYTKPFDVVIDPFAGGGSTIDLCRKRLRRYWVSDRAPVIEREKEIRKHDLTDGLPGVHNWKDVKLVYLDPPYWWQAKGKYSEDTNDLANMPLEGFTETLSGIVKSFSKKLTDAFIALVISPTQWPAPDRQYTDHLADLIRLIKLPIEMRFSAPYSTEQYNGLMVEWAQNNRKCLVLTREIIVWRA